MWIRSGAPTPNRTEAIRAEAMGSTTCIAVGITANGNAPVLALCRRLVEAGHNPDTPLQVWRGSTLAVTVRSIGEAAQLAVKEPDRGRVHFARYVPFAPSPVAPPVRKNAPPLCDGRQDWPAATEEARS
jgi:hypothetical protein